jgi:HEAT repeat protein
MSMGISWMKNSSWMAAGIILLATSVPARGRSVAAMPRDERHSSADVSTRAAEAVNDAAQDAQDRKQEAQDHAQEAREREQEARDREQEKRDRAQEQAERVEEAYDNGREALDEDKFDRAEQKFDEVAKMNAAQADAALYWKAYAQNKLGKRAAALATLRDLKQRFPQSRWQKDGGALEIEVQQSSGQPAKPEAQSDEELKMLAIQGLMNSDPDRAMPFLEKVLNGTGTPKEKSRAMFVMAQNGSPQSREILGRIARGQSNPDLQRKAVEYLGLFGGVESRKTLADVYGATSDNAVKRAVLKSFMLAGDKEHLFAAAKGEKDPDLRREAIRQLGLVHGVSELEQLYRSENSPELRRDILQAFFLAGDTTKLVDAAQNEKDPEVRRAAVRNLGLIGGDAAAGALQSIYARDTDRSTREEVLNALFIQGNAKTLVVIARAEKDPELRKRAVEKLALMNSKDASEYMMELLQK